MTLPYAFRITVKNEAVSSHQKRMNATSADRSPIANGGMRTDGFSASSILPCTSLRRPEFR